ncbi:MAG: hypothetical protein ACN4GW_03910 [Desulforhopalus sp.]
MFVNSWSIALLICSAAALFLTGGAVRTAIRVLRFWNPEVDTARQIRLENETWLAALFMEYAMLLQLISTLLLVQALDSYAEVLVGAMCATGALFAGNYGPPLLSLKIAGLFFFGGWIVIHRLDVCSEDSPLVRIKFSLLLLLLPLQLFDGFCLLSYLSELEPDIITSCCGVIFGGGTVDGRNMVGSLPVLPLMIIFYSLGAVIFGYSLVTEKRNGRMSTAGLNFTSLFFSFLWVLFFMLSLLVIVTVISSYIYGMPHHRCPFDILKQEYNYIGYPIYLTLFAATFAGASASAAGVFRILPGLNETVLFYQKTATRFSIVLLPLFFLLVSWFPVAYLLTGGER